MFNNANISAKMKAMVSSMFTEVSNVSYDIMTQQTGVKTEGGLLTLGDDDALDLNPLDFFSMEMPAFAMLTPIADVKRGDLLVRADTKQAYAFVLENGTQQVPQDDAAPEKKVLHSIQAMNFQGHITRFRPKNVTKMGVKDSVLVVKSLFNFAGQTDSKTKATAAGGIDMNMLMMMSMMGGKGDMSSMLPLLMMQGGGMQNMNPMLLMMMMGGKEGSSLFK